MISETPRPDPQPHDDGVGARMTLPEDVLLLLFNPRNGVIVGEGQPLLYTLGGAALVELALRGLIEVGEKRVGGGRLVRTVGETPPDDLLLDPVWERVARRPAYPSTLVAEFGPVLRERVIERLVERGELRREKYRALGVFPSTKLVAPDTSARDDLLGPVRAALVDGVEPDPRTAALAGLLSASDNLPAMHADIPWSGDVYTRGKKYERGDWGTKAAADVVRNMLVAQVVSSVFVSTAVSHSTQA